MDADIKSISVFTIVLLGIPGVLCKDNYDVGGMVAAAAIGLLFLAAAIVMGLFICFWPDYYHRQQMLRGKVRVARKKRKWRWWSFKRRVVAPPAPQHKQNFIPMHDIDRGSTLHGRERAESWMQKLHYDTHETKSKTINLEPEEDPPIIVADVMPPGTTENIETTRKYVYTDVDQSNYAGNDSNVLRYTVQQTHDDVGQVQHPATTGEYLEPIHIRLEKESADHLRSSQLRTTQMRSTTGTAEHIHIQPGQIL